MVLQCSIVGSSKDVHSDRTAYTIRVVQDGQSWEIKKHYSEFVALNEQLGNYPGLSRLQLPEKGAFGVRQMFDIGDFHAKRQQGLNQYLIHLASQLQHVTQSPALANFLGYRTEALPNSFGMMEREPASRYAPMQASQAQPVVGYAVTPNARAQPAGVQPRSVVQARPVTAQPVIAQTVIAQPMVMATATATATSSGCEARPVVQAQPIGHPQPAALQPVAAVVEARAVLHAQPAVSQPVAAEPPQASMGAKLPLNEAGYHAVVHQGSAQDKAVFLRRVVESEGGRVLNDVFFENFVPQYCRKASGYERLKEDLREQARLHGWLLMPDA